MTKQTEEEIAEILQRVAYCAIPISWRTNNPYPGVGNRKSTRRGPGLDFLGTALFQDGDDERHINWIATAQAGDDDEIYKTVYRQQKEIKAHIFVDVSRSMDFGSVRCTKRIVAAEAVASIIYALDKTRDKVACSVFSRDDVHAIVSSRSARYNLIPCLIEILESNPAGYVLAAAASAAASASALPPLPDAVPGDGLSKAIASLPPSRQLVFVVSDFMNMSKADWDGLGDLAAIHDVICIFVQDRRERELPEVGGFARFGFFYRIQDASGEGQWVWNSAKTRQQWAENWKAHEASISNAIGALGGELLILSTEEGDAAVERVLNLFAGHG